MNGYVGSPSRFWDPTGLFAWANLGAHLVWGVIIGVSIALIPEDIPILVGSGLVGGLLGAGYLGGLGIDKEWPPSSGQQGVSSGGLGDVGGGASGYMGTRVAKKKLLPGGDSGGEGSGGGPTSGGTPPNWSRFTSDRHRSSWNAYRGRRV